jgi:hypothetical protein
LPASEEFDAYTSAIRNVPDSATERFKFYWNHLKHENETIADDSSKEIAFALHEHWNADFRSFDLKPVVDLKQPFDFDSRFCEFWENYDGIKSWKKNAPQCKVALLADADNHGVRIPDAFLTFMDDIDLLTRIRSPNDCYFE